VTNVTLPGGAIRHFAGPRENLTPQTQAITIKWFACRSGSLLEPARLAADQRRAGKQQAIKDSAFGPLAPCAPRRWELFGGEGMYAVIRSGGKQYRVAPGDVIRVEKTGTGVDSIVEFSDVLAVSASEGNVAKPSEARVVGRVVGEDRQAKILVFQFKRKKQFKRLRGHRQPFTAVRITEIAFDGQKFTAPELPKKVAKPKKAAPAAEVTEKKAEGKAKAAPKKAAAKKPAAKKAAPKKKK
jgi:large subunit ribosomal protein L21